MSRFNEAPQHSLESTLDKAQQIMPIYGIRRFFGDVAFPKLFETVPIWRRGGEYRFTAPANEIFAASIAAAQTLDIPDDPESKVHIEFMPQHYEFEPAISEKAPEELIGERVDLFVDDYHGATVKFDAQSGEFVGINETEDNGIMTEEDCLALQSLLEVMSRIKNSATL